VRLEQPQTLLCRCSPPYARAAGCYPNGVPLDGHADPAWWDIYTTEKPQTEVSFSVALLTHGRRARLACVSRAFRQFCEGHATRKRQRTELIVPFEGWAPYVNGISRWLAWHANALRAVHVQILVRHSLLGRRMVAASPPCIRTPRPCSVPIRSAPLKVQHQGYLFCSTSVRELQACWCRCPHDRWLHRRSSAKVMVPT